MSDGAEFYAETLETAPIANNGHLNVTVSYSGTIGNLAEALATAQLEFAPIKKHMENTFYFNEKSGKKAMYADLAAIIEATQKPLAKNGLVVIQAPITDLDARRAGIRSRLIHKSGEWFECELLLPATSRAKRWKDGVQIEYEKFDAQTIGSAQSYARRYTYGPTVGVAAEEDDDANSIGEAANQGSKENAQEVAKKRVAEMQAKIDARKSSANVGAAESKTQEKAEEGPTVAPATPATIKIVSYPDGPDGDVEVLCSKGTAKMMGFNRYSPTSDNYWFVKHSALTKMYDKARNMGVTVESI